LGNNCAGRRTDQWEGGEERGWWEGVAEKKERYSVLKRKSSNGQNNPCQQPAALSLIEDKGGTRTEYCKQLDQGRGVRKKLARKRPNERCRSQDGTGEELTRQKQPREQ